MSKLLRRARVRFESAKMFYSRIGEDDANLDMCCFDLQQTLEFTLKFIVESAGRKYKVGHNLLLQLADLDELGVEIPDKSFYIANASIINTWETQTRYFDDFTAVLSLVDEVLQKLPSLIDFAENMSVEITEE
jgi:HEPN domain-containing protein